MPPKGKTAGKSSSSARGSSAARGGKSGRRPPPPVVVGKPKPWGLIALATAVVVFAIGVIGYAVYQVSESEKRTPEALAEAATKIPGIVRKTYPSGQHNDGAIQYADVPPFGGEHANAWADCTGVVYPNPIRQENAVHSQEHGAVWITYRPDLPADQVDALKKRVDGVDRMLMSPYPGLKSAISLQTWGYQLAVDSASDPRIDDFIKDLRLNPVTTPEPNATCVNPDFKTNPLPPGPSGAAPAPTPTRG